MWLCLYCYKQIEPDEDLRCCPNCHNTAVDLQGPDSEPDEVHGGGR